MTKYWSFTYTGLSLINWTQKKHVQLQQKKNIKIILIFEKEIVAIFVIIVLGGGLVPDK